MTLLPARGKLPAPLRKHPSLSSCPGLLARWHCLLPILQKLFSTEPAQVFFRKEMVSSSSHKALPDRELPDFSFLTIHTVLMKYAVNHHLTQKCFLYPSKKEPFMLSPFPVAQSAAMALADMKTCFIETQNRRLTES